VLIAMGVAGLVNMSMLIIAATLFHGSPLSTSTRSKARTRAFKQLVGPGAAIAFALALLASGFASSSVGHLRRAGRDAGLHQPPAFRSPCAALITMTPALVVLALGLDPTGSLVISQVIPVVRDPVRTRPARAAHEQARDHGELVNGRLTNVVATVVAGLIISLNLFLLWQTLA